LGNRILMRLGAQPKQFLREWEAHNGPISTAAVPPLELRPARKNNPGPGRLECARDLGESPRRAFLRGMEPLSFWSFLSSSFLDPAPRCFPFHLHTQSTGTLKEWIDRPTHHRDPTFSGCMNPPSLPNPQPRMRGDRG
jgi:hypothetical protein